MRKLFALTGAAWVLFAAAPAFAQAPAGLRAPLPTADAVAAVVADQARACTGCHGEQGRAGPDGYYPRLAGKPEAYLYRQLRHFNEGQRHHDPMRRLLATLDDASLRRFATHFSAIALPYPAPAPSRVDPDRLARGRKLAFDGDAAAQLPACADCHGLRLTGVNPDVPGLLGLPLDYLNAQLGAWRSGLRRTDEPDCMATIARRLSGPDLIAVTHWLASQTVPDQGRPATASEPGQRPARADSPSLHSRLCAPHRAEPAAIDAPTPPSPDPVVARGAYLARAGNCVACHTARGGVPMTGGRPIETPFGAVYSGNLTPDPQTGLGRWTADDFWNALHHGRSRDGRLLAPAFPYEHTTRIRREDSDAIFSWLKTLPAARAPQPPHRLIWPLGTQPALAVWRALFFRPADFSVEPSRDAAWTRGAYLVESLGHCAACHAPRNRFGAIRDIGDLSGARMPVVGWYAPSLLDDRETGLASTPIAQTVQLLKTGIAPHASSSGPMAEVVQHGLQHLDEPDLRAIAVYLQSRASARAPATPPSVTRAPSASEPARLRQAVAQPPADLPVHELQQHTEAIASGAQAPASSNASTGHSGGAALYRRHCADCHGERGEGRTGRYPALRGNRAVLLDDPTNVVLSTLHGGYLPATAGNPVPLGMPPFLLQLDPAELATLISWIRGDLQGDGRRAGRVSALEVVQVRERSRW